MAPSQAAWQFVCIAALGRLGSLGTRLAVKLHVHKMADRTGDSVLTASSEPCNSKKRKVTYIGVAKYRSKFKSEWSKLYPVKAVKSDEYSFYCVPVFLAVI
ncbi:hypothetical protein OS493_000554 [Desmophyllum pertusum]|uniref:Uncharacterized protein n=1 Tax=Desmophyllum pertusum TaxID=174260 RepID=A0A9X0A7A2_9CNID|nr:hypothetical protein OS493_000554 [Desmophyllum pertusum]